MSDKKLKAFLKKAKAHFGEKLEKAKEPFGVKAITDDAVWHNAKVVVECGLFYELAKQLGYEEYVDFPPGQNQAVFVIFSEKKLKRKEAEALYELWKVVDALNEGNDPLDAVACYDGPDKLEIPDDLEDEDYDD